MVFLSLRNIQRVPLLLSLVIFLSACVKTNPKKVDLVDSLIEKYYIQSHQSQNTLDKYSCLLDKSKSTELKNKLKGNYKSTYFLSLKDNILYIKIRFFDITVVSSIRRILKTHDKRPHSIILDLRNNTGGLLEESIKLVDLFIEKGIILYEKDRFKTYTYHAHKKTIFPNIPLVILVNSLSASASEIVAGSLQLHQRAILIGTKTFGKSAIQDVIPIDKDEVIKLTVSKYLLSDKKDIENEGIQPDFSFKNSQLILNSNKK
ncbi:MAG: S41 family peptidase [Sulfurovum sp.]|nr:S41 family peptidase [Sulfurovum sp.]